MARKGNQQKNGLGRNAAPLERKDKEKVHKGEVAETEDILDGRPSLERLSKTKHSLNSQKNNHKATRRPPDTNSNDYMGNESAFDASELRGNDHQSSFSFEGAMGTPGPSDMLAGWSLGASALSILKVAGGWLERQKPLFDTLVTCLLNCHEYIRLRAEHMYPIIWKWVSHFGKLVLLLSMVWLHCSLRGLDSMMRLGTTSFFSVIWCSILSLMGMAGVPKFLLMLVTAGLVALFVGFTLSLLVVVIFATIILWTYGSFWTTGFVILVAGVAFGLGRERLALLITTVYSLYCVKVHAGWLGLLLGINFSFVSSDLLIHFLKNNVNEHGSSPNQSGHTRGGQPGGNFYGEANDSFRTAWGGTMDHNSGIPSTSGTDMEITSEDEVVRLLNCTDHYSALGLPRYENIDVAYLKREYRKKAMLVHPDKNMGNEKAAEAFKKLQNAYEILLDSMKRKTYDDELRREELLNYFHRLQSASHKNARSGFFASGLTRPEAEEEDPHGDSRRIACKKCNSFHIWVHTDRSKSRARWCQECKDFHQAKDGDGWVEQSFQPFVFGLLQKADAPRAYVCAESQIYDATKWFICQGMRCPVNTHKPSFHVNTSIASKQNSSKVNSTTHRGGGPPPNVDEPMTEEEFFEWLQNAVQSGMFESNSPSGESPFAKAGSSSKSNSGKKKKKAKKQW